MNVFTCENNLEAILTCIYDAWASKLGHRNLRLMLEPVLEPELFCDYIHTEPDSEKVSKVIRSIRKKISAEAWQMASIVFSFTALPTEGARWRCCRNLL